MAHELRKLLIDDTEYWTRHTRKWERRKRYFPSNPKQILAAIPGVIHTVSAKPGQKVKWGESLVVLEAMKMRNSVTAPRDAMVRSVPVRVGQMVTKGQLLIEFE